MTSHEIARQLLAAPDVEATVSIYNPDGAPIFGEVDAVVADEGNVFISVPRTDARRTLDGAPDA
jgi:hypothetical protein